MIQYQSWRRRDGDVASSALRMKTIVGERHAGARACELLEFV
jgi:hypothetical protein